MLFGGWGGGGWRSLQTLPLLPQWGSLSHNMSVKFRWQMILVKIVFAVVNSSLIHIRSIYQFVLFLADTWSIWK